MTPLNDDVMDVLNALGEYERRTGLPRIAVGGWRIEDQALQPPESLVKEVCGLPPRLTHYADVAWCAEAKAQAADLFGRYLRCQGDALTPAHVAVLPSGSNGLLLALTFLRDHGVRVIYAAAPNYFATFQICRHLGLSVEILPPTDFLSCRLDYDRIARALQTPASALVVTNPAYSVGVEYTPEEVAQLCAVTPPHAYLVLDEVYLGLNWRNDAFWVPQQDCPARVIRLRSPSKLFLMYGAKLCFVVASPVVIHYMEMLAEFLSSAPGHFEALALAYLHALATWDQEVRQAVYGEFHQWKARIRACLARNLQQLTPLLEEFGFRLTPIDSGPYVTAAIVRAQLTRLDPVDIARRHGVMLITSADYYHPDPQWFGFRINLCGQIGEFAKGLRRVLPACLKTSGLCMT